MGIQVYRKWCGTPEVAGPAPGMIEGTQLGNLADQLAIEVIPVMPTAGSGELREEVMWPHLPLPHHRDGGSQGLRLTPLQRDLGLLLGQMSAAPAQVEFHRVICACLFRISL